MKRLSRARTCPFYYEKSYFEKAKVTVISATVFYHLPCVGVEPEKGDEAFYQIWTPLLTVQQWNAEFFSHLWTHDIKSVSFCFTHLLSSPPSSTNHLSALLQSPTGLKVIFSCLSLAAVSNLRALKP